MTTPAEAYPQAKNILALSCVTTYGPPSGGGIVMICIRPYMCFLILRGTVFRKKYTYLSPVFAK